MPKKQTHEEILGSEAEPNACLIVLFIPSKTDEGKELPPRGRSADGGGRSRGHARRAVRRLHEMPTAKGRRRSDDGEIIPEPAILVHSYAQQSHVEDDARMEKLAKFLHRMGKKTHQGEVAVVIDDVLHRIRKFPKA